MDNVFGIILRVALNDYQYEVGHDAALWDWLVADNAVPAIRRDKLSVPAPTGYVFNANALIKDSPAFAGQMKEFPDDCPSLTKNGYVNVGKVSVDKALMVLREESDTLTSISEEQFAALQIDESRVMSVSWLTHSKTTEIGYKWEQ